MTRLERLCSATSTLSRLLIEVGGEDEELREAIKDARTRAASLAMLERRSGGEDVDPWDR